MRLDCLVFLGSNFLAILPDYKFCYYPLAPLLPLKFWVCIKKSSLKADPVFGKKEVWGGGENYVWIWLQVKRRLVCTLSQGSANSTPPAPATIMRFWQRQTMATIFSAFLCAKDGYRSLHHHKLWQLRNVSWDEWELIILITIQQLEYRICENNLDKWA